MTWVTNPVAVAAQGTATFGNLKKKAQEISAAPFELPHGVDVHYGHRLPVKNMATDKFWKCTGQAQTGFGQGPGRLGWRVAGLMP